MPGTVSARGESYLQPGVQDVVFVNLHFPDRRMAQIHVSWLDPHKMRKMTIVGTKKMVVFDDMEAAEKIKIYDKGATSPDPAHNEGSRCGGGHPPPGVDREPLRECRHFVDCVRENRRPKTSGEDGLRVVRVLEAAQQSIEEGGRPVTLDEPRGAARRGRKDP
jgi:predicted dehydrogenase